MNAQYIGSDFDDFLAEEGLLADAEAVAVKRVTAFQLAQVEKEKNLSKREAGVDYPDPIQQPQERTPYDSSSHH